MSISDMRKLGLMCSIMGWCATIIFYVAMFLKHDGSLRYYILTLFIGVLGVASWIISMVLMCFVQIILRLEGQKDK